MLTSTQIFEVQGKLRSLNSSSTNFINLKNLREPINKQITVTTTTTSSSNFNHSQQRLTTEVTEYANLMKLPSSSFLTTASPEINNKTINDLQEEISILEDRIGRRELFFGAVPVRMDDFTIFNQHQKRQAQQQQSTPTIYNNTAMMSELKDAWAKLEHVLDKYNKNKNKKHSSTSSSDSSLLEDLLFELPEQATQTQTQQHQTQLLQSAQSLYGTAERLRRNWMTILREIVSFQKNGTSSENQGPRAISKIEENSKVLDELEQKVERMESSFMQRRETVLQKLEELEAEVRQKSASVVNEW